MSQNKNFISSVYEFSEKTENWMTGLRRIEVVSLIDMAGVSHSDQQLHEKSRATECPLRLHHPPATKGGAAVPEVGARVVAEGDAKVGGRT